MSACYLLNRHVQFWPEEHKLVGLRAGRYEHILNVPASRCLELLIERAPALVPQHDFYEYVWGEEGKEVSVRTLYQNIALLRKGLRTVDPELESAIVTLPKKGFQLSESLSIERGDQDKAQKIQAPSAGTPQFTLPVSLATVETEPKNETQRTTRVKHYLKTDLQTKLAFIFVMLIVVGCVVYGYMQQFQDTTEVFFSQYVPVKQIKECHFYALKDTNVQSALSVYWATGNIDCKQKPWLYITLYEFSNFGSVLACDRPFSAHSGALCDTYTQLSVDNK